MKRLQLTLLLLFVQCLCSCSSHEFQRDEHWYEKPSFTVDHDNHLDLTFMLGEWHSQDASHSLKETWARSSDDLFTGRRTRLAADGSAQEIDTFVFKRGRTGLQVVMTSVSGNGQPVELFGRISRPTKHRAIITITGPDDTLVSSSYDSPAPDCLDVEIETNWKGVRSKKTFRLKRGGQQIP